LVGSLLHWKHLDRGKINHRVLDEHVVEIACLPEGNVEVTALVISIEGSALLERSREAIPSCSYLRRRHLIIEFGRRRARNRAISIVLHVVDILLLLEEGLQRVEHLAGFAG